MDNLCHTLVGAAIGEAGLKRRTRYGSAALMIAANLPDVDVLVFATSVPSVAFRRGWTHGVLAQALLPVVFAAVMTLAARRRGHGAASAGARVHFGWLLALSYIGVLSHVFLDYLNNYGIRLLAPFDWRWFYGDAVFIIDIWLWVVLGVGVWVARRRGQRTAAAAALAIAAVYVAVMLGSARAARPVVSRAWAAQEGHEPLALMAGPVPVTPFRRDVIVDAGREYAAGTLRWPREVAFARERVPKHADARLVARAREAPNVRGFLVWARFPYWEVRKVPGGALVTVRDMRFGERFAASTIVKD
jgi:inner membrane protein